MIIKKDVSVGHTIISNIQSFISNRAKVNISFTELLKQYTSKSDMLSNVKKDWEILSNEQTLICSKVNNFFCTLHLLENMAECTSHITKKIEDEQGNSKSNVEEP